jgi:disulfide bond formation protein DsbB
MTNQQVPDGTRTTRIIASLLSLVMTLLSLHPLIKHRQAEVANSQWLEAYEEEFSSTVGAPKWPMHGRSWADYRNNIDPDIGRLGGLSKLTGFRMGSWSLWVFGMAAIVVLVLAILMPGWLGSS